MAAKALSAEREKVFDSMAPLEPAGVVRGQYAGYREEEGVAEDSDTETLVALRASVDNWRWDGVPFYLRSGKRMAENRHLLTVAFKQPPRRMFPLDCEHLRRRRARFRRLRAPDPRRTTTEKGPNRGPLFPKDVPPESSKSLARRSSSLMSATPAGGL